MKKSQRIPIFLFTFSIITAIGFFLWVSMLPVTFISQVEQLEDIYALVAITFLYATLLAHPVCKRFPSLLWVNEYLNARQALGISATFFALLHAMLAFFGQLGGFAGLGFLDTKYLTAVTFSFTALIILLGFTVSGISRSLRRVSQTAYLFFSKLLYLAGIFILIHAVMLGSHFTYLSDTIPQILYFALAILLLLESPAIDIELQRFFPFNPKIGISTVFTAVILTVFYFYEINPFPHDTKTSFNVHASHIKLAQLALQDSKTQTSNSKLSSIPGLNGDRLLRYTESFFTPDNPQPNQDIPLKFRIYNASSGNVVSYFRALYEKPMHLIIVDSGLTYFSHIHPTQIGQDFVVTTQFPNASAYHLYTTYQPFGGIEQQDGFILPVGTVPDNEKSIQPVDTKLTKIYGNYEVTLNTHGMLKASEMTLGQQTISFTIIDTQTKKPVTNLKPYLAAFGHLTMINESTYDFIHVHPSNLTAPQPDANGGPTVDFLPIGIYGPFKPGIYRCFAEFNPGGTLFIADFTVEIE